MTCEDWWWVWNWPCSLPRKKNDEPKCQIRWLLIDVIQVTADLNPANRKFNSMYYEI